MALLNFTRKSAPAAPPSAPLAAFPAGTSFEVMPRTATKVESFAQIFPAGGRVSIAHIEGTPISEMVATAARLAREGFTPMPHFPARIITDRATLLDWVARYKGEAGVHEALILAGGPATPAGAFHSSMQLLESGAFDGFTRLHVAGHPEGNRDIDPKGGEAEVMKALAWKQAFAERSDAEVAIMTQFAFDPAPIIAWTERLQAAGVTLPIHIGVAGPAKLQTLIKYAVACGVGPSLGVLQRRARDVSRLVMPFEPTELVTTLAARKAADPAFAIEAVHIFPLGGITRAAEWAQAHGATAPAQQSGKDRA